MVNIILFVGMYPILFLLYFVQKGEGKTKLRTLFGIRFSKEWLSDTEREQLETDYRRSMNRFLLILGILPVITFFIPYFSIHFSFWMIWMFAVIIMFMLPYYKGNQKLQALKTNRCQQEAANNIIYAELKNAGAIRLVKWKQFVPPSIISILLAVFSILYFSEQNLEVYGGLLVTFALCTLLFYGCAVYMDKMKTKVISSNSDVNVNYSRANKKIYKDFWLLSVWLNNAFIMILFIAMVAEASRNIISSHVILWSSVLYTLIELFFCMRMLDQVKNLTKQYEQQMNLKIDDDEKNWIGGMFYYNPNDKHTIVSKRVGIGTTINMATPFGKASIIFTALTLLSIPIMCVWIILLEFTPISLSVRDDVLIARHLSNDYAIATDTITELSLEDELPRNSKINGTGMDNLQKGQFRNSIDGRIQMFLNPQNEYYLRIVSEDTIYYFGGYDDKETLAVYNSLLHKSSS